MARLIDGLIETVQPVGYVYAPAGRPLDPATLVGRAGDERWSREGELAVYLALAADVVLGEWSRHLVPDQPMTAWRVTLGELRIVDLRRPAVADALFLPDDPAWLLDRGRTQSVAAMIRGGLPVDGLIVPSVAFLDRPEAANLVIWLDRREDIETLVRSRRPIGGWSWSDGAGRTDEA